MFPRPYRSVLSVLALALLTAVGAHAQTKLLRYPDIAGERVAFCHAGDIWTAPAAGGTATRLTAHPGREIFPRFSPDGEWIAFTGQYDGDEHVYVVSAAGGVPRRLTYYPAQGPLAPRHGHDHQVTGWTPDGSGVVFRGFRDAGGASETNLYVVPFAPLRGDVSNEGGLPRKLPMPTSGAGDFSADGGRVVYSPLFRDFRSWKRYSGGWTQDLYIFDLETHDATKIADSDRSERDPMWIGDKVYFSSDRDGTLNLYSYDVGSGEVAQHTHSDTWDVRWPSSDNASRIVYELDGELEIYDLEAAASKRISIEVPNDGVAMRPARISVVDDIEDFALSPKGERVLVVARGDVFTAPIEHGPTRNLTRSSGAHDKWARWSPDGKQIAFISDLSGEEEVYLVPQDGSGEPVQLTEGGTAMRYAPEWAPDGKRLAFSDKDGKVYVLDVATKNLTEIADDSTGMVRDYNWSPHGGHLAFSMGDANDFDSIYIWSATDGQVRRVTSGLFDEVEPVWDRGGDYLYYLSRRQFAPQISMVEWNYAGNRNIGLFALALREEVENPFAPESDEVTIDEEEEDGDDSGEDDDESEKKGKKGKKGKKDDDGDEKDKEEKEYLKIDFDGLAGRVARLPAEADNYVGLAPADGHLLYVSFGAPFYGRQSYENVKLHIFSFEDREASTLADDIDGYAVSADGKKVLVFLDGSFQIYDAKAKASGEGVSTRGLMVDRVPAEEWEQIFGEVWRRFRDFFYVENMHGYDWRAIGDRYRQLLPHVAHRSDLNYVISEMISELSIGHAYIEGGDYEVPDRARVGLPGARFELDEESGRYLIADILEGANEEPRYRSPLTAVGVDANEGDYVLAIDGVELEGTDNPYRLLQHKTDPVTLTLASAPDSEETRKVAYEPIRDESRLRYLSWVNHNREKVDEMTGGRVGYLHIPNMGASGIAEFIKWYYPQIRKEGLVVDVRSNGGGNVSQWIIERLDTRLLGTRFGRVRDGARTYPYSVFHGHMVCLLNETSASDGDIFPYRFREAGLGPLIGKRSWGGVVGISGRGRLIDGGQVFVPEAGTNDVDGEYIIEGHGVDPDIEVENDPKSVLAGGDPQLERGVAEVMEKIEAEPKKLPERPADPVKTE
ncbi:MAG: peptidase S41 [bacterium]|nr:peptidase S41 [bacterium]